MKHTRASFTCKLSYKALVACAALCCTARRVASMLAKTHTCVPAGAPSTPAYPPCSTPATRTQKSIVCFVKELLQLWSLANGQLPSLSISPACA